VMEAILEPAISQKRSRLLSLSFFSRTSFTRALPLLRGPPYRAM
jgi:hypothetical protein